MSNLEVLQLGPGNSYAQRLLCFPDDWLRTNWQFRLGRIDSNTLIRSGNRAVVPAKTHISILAGIIPLLLPSPIVLGRKRNL